MFTGIIQAIGAITSVEASGTNRTFWVESPVSDQLKVDQSLCHDGICLTVEEIRPGAHRVTAIAETLDRSTANSWDEGTRVNLERSLTLESGIDGHLVQGHVDSTGTCIEKKDMDGSWEFKFGYPDVHGPLLIEKGSICVNGVSLTCFQVSRYHFKVAVIPFTLEHTNLADVSPGKRVNLEFDMIGKYVLRNRQLEEARKEKEA